MSGKSTPSKQPWWQTIYVKRAAALKSTTACGLRLGNNLALKQTGPSLASKCPSDPKTKKKKNHNKKNPHSTFETIIRPAAVAIKMRKRENIGKYILSNKWMRCGRTSRTDGKDMRMSEWHGFRWTRGGGGEENVEIEKEREGNKIKLLSLLPVIFFSFSKAMKKMNNLENGQALRHGCYTLDKGAEQPNSRREEDRPRLNANMPTIPSPLIFPFKDPMSIVIQKRSEFRQRRNRSEDSPWVCMANSVHIYKHKGFDSYYYNRFPPFFYGLFVLASTLNRPRLLWAVGT